MPLFDKVAFESEVDEIGCYECCSCGNHQFPEVSHLNFVRFKSMEYECPDSEYERMQQVNRIARFP
jgi:hypothetical protein